VIIDGSVAIQRRAGHRRLDKTSRHQLVNEIEHHQIAALGDDKVNSDGEVLCLEGNGGVVERLAN
jgi:hypothetical protein